jgi:heterodisulfide reductase subunit A-like polyferredoxin
LSAAASLDPADACYKVWLVEEQAAIGGEAVYFRATLRAALRRQ